MSSFAIVTDSTANLPKAFIEKQGIYVLPLTWISGEKEYSGSMEGEREAYALFYEKLRKEKHISTSMSNQRTAQKLVQKLLSEEKDILYIGLSSKLSGTFHMMERVLGYEAKKYPERKIYRTAACTAFGDNKTRKCGKSEYMRCSLVQCCRKSVRKPEVFRTLFCTFFGKVNILGTEDTECVPVTDYMYV